MKKLSILALSIFTIILTACSGSDRYRGSWKATDSEGSKFVLMFDDKSLTVTDSTGQSKTFNYTQNSVEFKNSVEKYGITLGDGKKLIIRFPDSKQESMGQIKDEADNPIYTISRSAYIK